MHGHVDKTYVSWHRAQLHGLPPLDCAGCRHNVEKHLKVVANVFDPCHINVAQPAIRCRDGLYGGGCWEVDHITYCWPPSSYWRQTWSRRDSMSKLLLPSTQTSGLWCVCRNRLRKWRFLPCQITTTIFMPQNPCRREALIVA